jgi:hypothetical protein
MVWPSQVWCSEQEFEATLYIETLNWREKYSSYISVNKGTLLLLFVTQYRAGDKIEKIEMGWACSTYGGRERCVQGSGGETWGKESAGETQA